MNLRTIAERLSRGVVLRRRLPDEFGGAVLHVSPEGGGLRYWRHDVLKMDPGIFKAVALFAKPGAVVWDVGANMGLFAFAAASRSGPNGLVLAIEPDIDNARLLLRTRTGLPSTFAPVQVLTCAVSDAPFGLAEFEIAGRSRASNSIKGAGHSQRGGVRETRIVPLVNLDGLLGIFGSPDLVKIDVEGAEEKVVAGALRVLATARPVLVIEVDRGSADAVGLRLKAAGYRLFDGDAPWEERAEIATPVWNTYAIPEERVSAVVGKADETRPA
jgi:FkbM family methyltransferase